MRAQAIEARKILRAYARWLALAAAFQVLGCGSGASFQSFHAQPSYVPPEHVNVQLRNRTGAWDFNEKLDGLYATLRDELARHGIRASRSRGAARTTFVTQACSLRRTSFAR